ncbi:MAG: trypsin-like peptidase domain-containing protein [Alphaproteobacteria bacterium]|jgi:Do/DeqQ family serine protease|nr:trypsin-like peptidase domain-containing protein [Alphaproteobacteria bacterium]
MRQQSLLVLFIVLFTIGSSFSVPSANFNVSYAPIVKMAAPAVVSISTSQKMNISNSLLGNDPFFNFFFGVDPSNPQLSQAPNVTRSLGSGVIVDASGIVVTCSHVVDNAEKISIKLSDNREFEGQIIAKDKANDLVAIRLIGLNNPSALPVVVLETNNVEVGDLLLAIGNPFGVGQTVTNGIVSAIARNVRGRMLIQTDAPINPGNSGGALISMNGKLIGIPNAILSKTGSSHGIGFAIPATLIQNLLDSINNGGVIRRPWAGIDGQRLTTDLATSLMLQTPQGVLVTSIHPLSPAKPAGLAQGDVITGINGQTLSNPEEFIYRIQSIPFGQNIVLDVVRNQNPFQVSFQPISPPAIPKPDTRRIPKEIPLLGDLEVANLSPALVSEYQLPIGTPERGIIITDTGRNMIALQLKLNQGDCIEQINQRRIESVQDLFEAIPNLQNPGSIIFRQGNRRIEVNTRQ